MLQATTPTGESVFTGRVADLNAATEWARSFCHLALGPVAGETHFRKLPAKSVLSLWAKKKVVQPSS